MATPQLQIGESARVNDQEKFWSGENYGWQSKEQHDKLKEEGKFKFGTQALDRIQSSAVNAIGGENLVKMAQGFSAVSEPLSKVLKFNPQLSGLYQAQENVGELTSQTSGAVSDALNVDKRITDTAAVAAEAFLTGGGPGATKRAAGKLMQATDTLMQPNLKYSLAGASGDIGTVMRITLKDPENIPRGIGQGSASGPEFGPQVKAFFDRREKLRQQLKEQMARGSNRAKKTVKQTYNDVSTGPSRDPLADPEAYRGESTSKYFDQYREPSVIDPTKMQEQHHLFPKQETHAFVERMIELGDEDDVLAMFIMAEDMDATMGGRLSNMLNMEQPSHNVLHESRKFDGRQLKQADMKKLLQKAKTTDELMSMFRKYVTENVIPSKTEAKAIEKLFKDLKYNTEAIDMLRDKNMRS
jgi:hypothetical protein